MSIPESTPVQYPDLSEGQERAVKERLAKEWGVKVDAKGDAVKKADGTAEREEGAVLSVDPDEFVYTNATNSDLVVDDLGIKSASGAYSPCSFAPYEAKDLRRIYKAREIRSSAYLRILVDDKRLRKGRVPKDQLIKEEEPLARMARANAGQETTFTDPTRVGAADGNHYDQKLKELQDRDQQEDMDSRKK